MAKKKAEDTNITMSDKEKALSTTIDMIRKKYGSGAIMQLGEDGDKMKVEMVPTGSLALDIALGGGIPKGRIVEIYGAEAGGKTTLSLHMVAEVQKRGGVAGFIDAEHALDPIYAKSIGVNVDDLFVSQPDSGEQALEICEMMVRSGAVDIVIVDSVAALTPQAEIDGEMGDMQVGLQARLMSKALRKLTAAVNNTKCIVIFINQIREKVGIMFGSPETTTGGRALKFYSSIRLDIRRTDSIKIGNALVGNHVRVKVVKNKVAPPFKSCSVDIIFGKGISKEGELLDVGVEKGFIQKTGNWYVIDGEKIGNGREAAKDFLLSNEKIAKEIEEKIRASFAAGGVAATDDGEVIE